MHNSLSPVWGAGISNNYINQASTLINPALNRLANLVADHPRQTQNLIGWRKRKSGMSAFLIPRDWVTKTGQPISVSTLSTCKQLINAIRSHLLVQPLSV